MTARKPPERHPDPETARLLDDVIAALAGACRDADMEGLNRPRRAGIARLAREGERMRPLAARVARCMAAGDYAGADRLLSAPRTPRDWRRLSLALASMADPALGTAARAEFTGTLKAGAR